MRSIRFLVFFAILLFVQPALGQQQQQPDANCSAWLATTQGQAFVECENDFPGLPTKSPDNGCSVTLEDYNLLCNDECFTTVTEGYNYILSTGTCLSFYEDKFGTCTTADDCTGSGKVCYNGVCYNSCNTTDDCNSCNSEFCDTLSPLGQVRACRSNLTERNGTSTFRGNVYTLQSACVKNEAGDFCSLLFAGISGNLSSVTCADFDTWGCCLGTMLESMEYCEYQRFTNSSIYQCDASQKTCSTLPSAQEFCAIKVNQTGTNFSSSGSSSMTGSSRSSMTGHTGIGGGNNSTDGNSADTTLISWSLLIGLITLALS